VKIQSIQTVRLNLPKCEPVTPERRPSWWDGAEIANPMSVYPRFKKTRSLWLPKWSSVGVKVTAEDGTWGLGMTSHGRPVAAVIEDHFAQHLAGENCLSIEKLWDMMFRMSKPYGSQGLVACAISGVDLALWDLAGKLHERPVYELMGGPVRDKIFCYATGNDTDWYQELGFHAFKLACPYGPADGLDGLKANEDFVGEKRQQLGDDVDIMLDCYMAFDIEYTVRLAERLRPYKLRWIEECLIPEDIDGHKELRRRIQGVSLASGEHMTTRFPFKAILDAHALDIVQPDIFWVGGLSEASKVADMASAAGIEVCLHAGGAYPYGQHFSIATPNVRWIEYLPRMGPGVPLAESSALPGMPVPEDGYLVPSDEPGFGLNIKEEWLSPFFG